MKHIRLDDEVVKRHLGRRLMDLRIKANLSQQTVAYRVGCSQRAVAYWEMGERLPHSRELWALCQLYGLTVEAMVGDIFPSIKERTCQPSTTPT